ncbi:hypothetical protein [Leifsonia sp. PS1209]|uniref:hypothetical protein n=1 Tax=Leifsonia sp. PS1209 TaxID=2724914 RepID=UPI001442CF1D|nr:hypothetical protein [Leifsonia sp. PS1209]QIZ99428.1 hypothetical protein HF024_13515 [Leifsonia sp. PS1209]
MKELAPGEYTDPVVEPSPVEEQHRGAWQATVHFRKLDGDEVQWELCAYGDSEEVARLTAIAAVDDERGMHVQTMGYDSPAVRTYIAAASHMHDLRRALSALECAAVLEDNTAKGHLRAQAVSVYGRTWNSNARPDLADIIEFSEADVELTESIRILRNRFTVHSENSMTTTVPLFDLERQPDGAVSLEEVRSATFEHPLPEAFVEGLHQMLERLAEQLTARLKELKQPIVDEVTPEMLSELFQHPELVQVRAVAAADWSPDDRRPPFPSSRFRDVHIVEGESGSTSATLT